MDIQLLIMETL